jgi:Peptidase inhibitor family I36
VNLSRVSLAFLLLVMTLVSSAGRLCAQDRYEQDRDQDRYDHDRNRDDQYRRGGACFFRDIDFGGEKFCVRPGERVAQVPPGFNDHISSIRIFGRTEVTIYQGRDFQEPSLRLREDVANLQRFQVQPGHSWNDRVSSIEVVALRNAGDWDHEGACFFKDENFRGEKFCVQKGDRLPQVPQGFSDRISSVRIYGRATAVVFQDAGFRGKSLEIRDDVVNLQSFQVQPGHSWNDRISSIRVY